MHFLQKSNTITMPDKNRLAKKKKAIQDDYENLFRSGKSKSKIITEIASKYFMSDRAVYNLLEVKSLRKERKLITRKLKS